MGFAKWLISCLAKPKRKAEPHAIDGDIICLAFDSETSEAIVILIESVGVKHTRLELRKNGFHVSATEVLLQRAIGKKCRREQK